MAKGFAIESVIATIMVVMLITVFILAVLQSNNRFIEDGMFTDAQRSASVLAERMFFESGGITGEPENFVSVSLPFPAKIVLTDTERGMNWTSGGTGNATSAASAAAAMLVYDGGRYYPAILEVFVPA